MGSPYVILAICILAAAVFVLIVWQLSRYVFRATENRNVIDGGKPITLPLLLFLGPVILLALIAWRVGRRG
ncbi:MAG: hypothetical protein V3S51_00700 [Dehalococcoidia bacterium]